MEQAIALWRQRVDGQGARHRGGPTALVEKIFVLAYTRLFEYRSFDAKVSLCRVACPQGPLDNAAQIAGERRCGEMHGCQPIPPPGMDRSSNRCSSFHA